MTPATMNKALAAMLDAVCPPPSQQQHQQLQDADKVAKEEAHYSTGLGAGLGAAVAAGSSQQQQQQQLPFETMDNLRIAFEAMREKHGKYLGKARKTMPPPPQPSAAAPQPRSAAGRPREVEDEPPQPRSLMLALLTVVDPSVGLLPPSDVARCLEAFVEKTVASIVKDPWGVAAAYLGGGPKKGAAAQEVVSSLYDARHVLTDAGMNDAALCHVASLIGTALVLARDGPGRACEVIMPSNGSSESAVMIVWDAERAAYRVAGRTTTLAEIQAQLKRDVLKEHPGIASKVASMDRASVEALAGRLALRAPKTKGGITTKAAVKRYLQS